MLSVADAFVPEVIDPKKFAGLESCACGGKLGYLTRPGKRAEVACVVCHFPAPADHPLCRELAADYAEAEAKAKVEAARPAAPSGMKGVFYGDPDAVAGKQYAALREEVAALTARLASAETEIAQLRQATGRKAR